MNIDDVINTGDPREIKRAVAVKMSIAGFSRPDIGEILSVTPAFVSKWKSIYYESGAEALLLSYKGSAGYLEKEERIEIIDYIKQKDSIDINEMILHIEKTYNVKYSSLKSYYELLHEAGLNWKKTEKSNPKKDESLVSAKREEIKKNFWRKPTT